MKAIRENLFFVVMASLFQMGALIAPYFSVFSAFEWICFALIPATSAVVLTILVGPLLVLHDMVIGK